MPKTITVSDELFARAKAGVKYATIARNDYKRFAKDTNIRLRCFTGETVDAAIVKCAKGFLTLDFGGKQ